MILADTSVWIDHLRGNDPQMNRLLRSGAIAIHPFVVAEIALGFLHNRRNKLVELDQLRTVNLADISEVRHLIESQRLYSKGLGLTDVHLIASCMMTYGTQLWTRDKALSEVARSLGIAASLP